jgi:hypothetical protein
MGDLETTLEQVLISSHCLTRVAVSERSLARVLCNGVGLAPSLETPVWDFKTASGPDTKLVIPPPLDDTRHVKNEDEAECATDTVAWSPSWTAEAPATPPGSNRKRRGPSPLSHILF